MGVCLCVGGVFIFLFFFGGEGVYFVVFGVLNCLIFYIIMYNMCFLSLFNVICYRAISVTLITVYLLF